jgi:hypothetical protein
VIVKKTRTIKKRIESYNEVVARFQLNSKNKNTFVLNNLNENEFILEIENKDNPPLEIEKIQLFQKPIYLVANLKQQEKYTLIINNSLKKPNYDLGNFITDKTNVVAEVFLTDFSKIKNKKNVLEKAPFWKTTVFMWICIILGAIIVVYFAFGLLKDINNEEKNERL